MATWDFVAACRLSPAAASRGYSLVAEHGRLVMVASLVEGYRLYNMGAVVVVHGLSCARVCGIFQDEGSNLCPPCCQADS